MDSVSVEDLRRLVDVEGGRWSLEAGIDLEGEDREIDRWALAATLLGHPIRAHTAITAYRILDAAGISTIADTVSHADDELVDLLDQGGYTRYDVSTVERLRRLATALERDHPEGLAGLGSRLTDGDELWRRLDDLPGWGPVTVGAFLRELRGRWRGADPPVPERAVRAARRLGWIRADDHLDAATLDRWARGAGLDRRDLEAALVRAGSRRSGVDETPAGSV